MALPIQVNPKDPFIDIHTGRGQGSCTFANGFDCVCSCAGIAHAQLLRMVLTPENSKKLPDKYKQALANKVQTVQARIADIPHDKVTTIIHAQKQPKRVFFLCEDVSHPIIDYCRVIDILRWARENPLASQQVSKLCTCVQNHGINYKKDLSRKESFQLTLHSSLSPESLFSKDLSASAWSVEFDRSPVIPWRQKDETPTKSPPAISPTRRFRVQPVFSPIEIPFSSPCL